MEKVEDTYNDKGIECPYCHYVDEDIWDSNFFRGNDEEEYECMKCDKKFIAVVNTHYTFEGIPMRESA